MTYHNVAERAYASCGVSPKLSQFDRHSVLYWLRFSSVTTDFKSQILAVCSTIGYLNVLMHLGKSVRIPFNKGLFTPHFMHHRLWFRFTIQPYIWDASWEGRSVWPTFNSSFTKDVLGLTSYYRYWVPYHHKAKIINAISGFFHHTN